MTDSTVGPHEFDPEIIEIERNLHEFFVKGLTTFSGKDKYNAKIIACFFTRQVLTQSQIKQLTGLSTGAISGILKKFVESNSITKSSQGGKYHYTMEGITFGKSDLDKYSKMIEEMHLVQQELEKNKDNFKVLEGYSEAKELTIQLLDILNVIHPSMKEFEQELSYQRDELQQ